MTDQIQTASARQTDPLSVLWRLLAAPLTLIILLGLVALALGLRSLIPQMPPGARADPHAWMALLPRVLGQRSGLLHAMGLLDITGAAWFQILLALAGLTFFVRAIESAELAWHARDRGNTLPTSAYRPPGLEPRGILVAPLPQHETLASTRRFLAERGFKIPQAFRDSGPNLVASRQPLLLWTRMVVYSALLAALLGVAITATFGWQIGDWRPLPGESLDVGHGTSYTLHLDSFELLLDADGRLLDYFGQLTWNRGNQVVKQSRVGVGKPATHRATALRLIGFAPHLQLRGWDETGRPLAFEAEGQEVGAPGKISVSFPSPDAQPVIYLPDQDQFLALSIEPHCIGDRPAVSLALAAISDQNASNRPEIAVLYESGDAVLSALRLEVDLSYRPILHISHQSATGLILAALILALGALVVSWAAPSHLLWITLEQESNDGTVLHLAMLPSLTGDLWSKSLISELDERLASDV